MYHIVMRLLTNGKLSFNAPPLTTTNILWSPEFIQIWQSRLLW